MTGCDWRGVGPFEDGIRISQRGARVHALIKACDGVQGTREALRLLGDPHDPARRLRAREILDHLPTRDRRRVISRYMIEGKGL